VQAEVGVDADQRRAGEGGKGQQREGFDHRAGESACTL
jgi:hypothetical protein